MKTIKFICTSVFLLFLLGVSACAQREHSALLPADQAKALARQCSRPGPPEFDDTWQPSRSVIRGMESRFAAIKDLRAKNIRDERNSIADPEKYYMQYVGIVVKGKKYIYINALFTVSQDDRWKKRAMIACDGGSSFWGVFYDVENRTFSDLAINGSV